MSHGEESAHLNVRTRNDHRVWKGVGNKNGVAATIRQGVAAIIGVAAYERPGSKSKIAGIVI